MWYLINISVWGYYNTNMCRSLCIKCDFKTSDLSIELDKFLTEKKMKKSYLRYLFGFWTSRSNSDFFPPWFGALYNFFLKSIRNSANQRQLIWNICSYKKLEISSFSMFCPLFCILILQCVLKSSHNGQDPVVHRGDYTIQ